MAFHSALLTSSTASIQTLHALLVKGFDLRNGNRSTTGMSSLLFNIAIDWVLRRTVEDQRRDIRCMDPFLCTRGP